MSIPRPDNQLPPRPGNGDARHQPMASFTPGRIDGGYHMDLRGVAGSYGPAEEAAAWLDLLLLRREHVLPVSVLQLGLGAWQRSLDPTDADRGGWAAIAQRIGDWAVVDMDGHGRFLHHQPMPHTYAIAAPWWSAMAQGLGASMLVRTGHGVDVHRAVASLLDPAHGLIAQTEHGNVLQEYPTTPPSHVLNGWMWALLGLYDASISPEVDGEVRQHADAAFRAGVQTLADSLPAYETGRGWSHYDRYPHPIANIASPFYHRLHVEMLRAVARVACDDACRLALEQRAARWEEALARPLTRAGAVARKVGFRLVRPRGRRVA